MKYELKNLDLIIDDIVDGFRQYIFDDVPCVKTVSENLCNLLEVKKEELILEKTDGYKKFVHPSDKYIYEEFMKSLFQRPQKISMEYRLITKSGRTIYVLDKISSFRDDKGKMIAYSNITDISHIKYENKNWKFFDNSMAVGFIKYTCEKQPRITYMNQQMKEFLRIPQMLSNEVDYLELYKRNLFLIIPQDRRKRFSRYLQKIMQSNELVMGEIPILRCDGSKGYLFGWMVKSKNEDGIEEFHSLCIDISAKYQEIQDIESQRYLKAIGEVYDKIFQYNYEEKTIKCLKSNSKSMLKWLEDIPVPMEIATKKWIADLVVDKDKERVEKFLKEHYDLKNNIAHSKIKPKNITYTEKDKYGNEVKYKGIFLKINENISLYCCKSIAESDEERVIDKHKHEEEIKEIVMKFTDGIAAFEIVPEKRVIPLYSSDNIRAFFGFSLEDWEIAMREGCEVDKFVANSQASEKEFRDLLEKGEAEFTYTDMKDGCKQGIKAICSEKISTENSSRYVILYKIDDKYNKSIEMIDKNDISSEDKPMNIVVRSFGYFDVFINGRPIHFKNKKSKELLALLVDRRGGFLESSEAIGFLWEDEPVNPVTLARYRKVALRLKNILEEHSISHIVESVDGNRRLVTEFVKCDLYDYLTGEEEYKSLFKGSYLSNYSWSENTLAELMNVIDIEDIY